MIWTFVFIILFFLWYWRSRRVAVIFDLNGVLCFKVNHESDIKIYRGEKWDPEYFQLRENVCWMLQEISCYATHIYVWTSRTRWKAEIIVKAIHFPFTGLWCQEQCVRIPGQRTDIYSDTLTKPIPFLMRIMYGKILFVDDSPEKHVNSESVLFLHAQKEWTTDELKNYILEKLK
jgi:hypothetical protein